MPFPIPFLRALIIAVLGAAAFPLWLKFVHRGQPEPAGLPAAHPPAANAQSETELNPKTLESVPDQYSSRFVQDHDSAVSLWFTYQYHAMSGISHDGRGKIRLKSYRSFSKFDDKAEDVLDLQSRALHEFIASYQGSDKETIVGQWLEKQNEAKNALREFLKSTGRDVSKALTQDPKLDQYDETLREQRVYLDMFREYRDDFNRALGDDKQSN